MVFSKPFYTAPFGPVNKIKKLSAVILTYNKADVLQVFLESLGKQTRRPDETILVDDASTDGTQELLRSSCSQWPIIQLPKNKGQSHARNIGLRAVHGQYVIFIDGDLEMKPRMLEVLEKRLDDSPDISIAYGHYDRCGSRTDNVKAIPWNPKELLMRNYISMISMVRRKDLPIPAFDEKLHRYEDWDLWLRMMKNGKKGAMVDYVLFTAFYKPEDLSGGGESQMWAKIVAQKHGLPTSREPTGKPQGPYKEEPLGPKPQGPGGSP